MATVTHPKVGRLTTETHYKSMENAFKGGFDAALSLLNAPRSEDGTQYLATPHDSLEAVDLWGFDPRETKPDAEKAPKKASPKKPSACPELADLDYNPELCRARWYNKGFGAQCWRNPADGEDVCSLCACRRDDDDKDFWGYFNEPLEDAPLNKDGKPHAWKKLQAERAAKKASDKALEKEKKEKEMEEKKAAKKLKKKKEKKAKKEKERKEK